jgi:putative toxin-antitoxin system antitoxin component (TIGR02293 family)
MEYNPRSVAQILGLTFALVSGAALERNARARQSRQGGKHVGAAHLKRKLHVIIHANDQTFVLESKPFKDDVLTKRVSYKDVLAKEMFKNVTPGLLENAVLVGFPKSALYNVSKVIESDISRANELAYSIVPKSTLSRRETLTTQQSERTERLARLFARAEYVLGGEEDAREFMHRRHPELDNRRPLDAVATDLGARSVERVLDSLEFGLPG